MIIKKTWIQYSNGSNMLGANIQIGCRCEIIGFYLHNCHWETLGVFFTQKDCHFSETKMVMKNKAKYGDFT